MAQGTKDTVNETFERLMGNYDKKTDRTGKA